MLIYLPIAEIPVNVLIILSMGGAVGFISGMFGVGGGFLLTPLLIFTGVPPAVAVASVASQIVASSTSGALFHWRRQSIDMPLALVLLAAGSVGSAAGVVLFGYLRNIGQLDLVLSLAYVTFLGSIGGLMLVESLNAMRRTRSGQRARGRKPGQHNWVHRLPWKVRFRRSRLYISIVPVIAIGSSIGFLGTMLGIGGGFIMVPALIYLLRVPTSVVIGTSLIQILGTMAIATILHAATTQTVDVVLALVLMVGGVIGAQLGARIGSTLKAEQLRLLLALIVLAVGVRFFVDLVLTPEDVYSLSVLERLTS